MKGWEQTMVVVAKVFGVLLSIVRINTAVQTTEPTNVGPLLALPSESNKCCCGGST